MTNAIDETPTFIQSGVLSNASAQVTIATTANITTVCFNSVGRLVANNSANVTAITGGDICQQPPGTPPVLKFNVNVLGADRPLQVNLGLGGQVHMCDPGVAISDAHPEGCP
jgi:type IV fimbrial biogenesis protein FimT